MSRFFRWARCTVILLPLVAAMGSACSSDEELASDDTLSVVASTQVIADWVRQLGGEHVTVRALVPAGADAHTLELTVDDIRAIADADLVVINGAGLEASYEDVIEENAEHILELADAVEAMGEALHPYEGMMAAEHDQHQQQQDQQAESEHEPGDEDPHFWFDTDIAKAAVKAIAAELIELRPSNAEAIGDRLIIYVAEIDKADERARALLSGLPANQRLLVTFHDAFGYFARRYGLEIAGFVVEGPAQGVSAESITDLIELINHEGVKTVFHEPQFDSAILDTISDETGARSAIIRSQPTDDKPTFVEILVANAKAVAEQ